MCRPLMQQLVSTTLKNSGLLPLNLSFLFIFTLLPPTQSYTLPNCSRWQLLNDVIKIFDLTEKLTKGFVQVTGRGQGNMKVQGMYVPLHFLIDILD